MYKVYMVYFIIEIVYYNTFIALLPFRIMYILSYIFPVGVIITIPGLYHCKITKVLDKVCIILILSYLFVNLSISFILCSSNTIFFGN